MTSVGREGSRIGAVYHRRGGAWNFGFFSSFVPAPEATGLPRGIPLCAAAAHSHAKSGFFSSFVPAPEVTGLPRGIPLMRVGTCIRMGCGLAVTVAILAQGVREPSREIMHS